MGSHRREEAGSGNIGLHNDMLVELLGVQADGLIEGGPLVVIQVHGDVHAVAEEPGPHLGLPVIQVLRASLQKSLEEVTVPVLVLLTSHTHNSVCKTHREYPLFIPDEIYLTAHGKLLEHQGAVAQYQGIL